MYMYYVYLYNENSPKIIDSSENPYPLSLPLAFVVFEHKAIPPNLDINL